MMKDSLFPKEAFKSESINFYSEDTSFDLSNPEQTISWIVEIIQREHHQLTAINYIFCSDEYLLKINQDFLDHDTLTDIITFPYSKSPIIESDIFISVDRVKENAEKFQTPFLHELHRVMIHGVLHLCGYEDKNEALRNAMRAKENEALSLIHLKL